MTLELAITNQLKLNIALAALITENGKFKCFPGGKVPDWVTDKYISFFRVSGGEFHNIPAKYPRYQFSCFAKDYATARKMAEAIKDTFKRFKGTLGGADGVPILQGVFEGDQDLYENDTGFFHIPVDIKFLYREA
jgi:hypothetical protein